MTTRAIFNRQYTDYTPGTQQVWLVNGAGVTTTQVTTQSFVAGTTLVQGQAVYVSGTYVLPATAASGVDSTLYNPIGITLAGAASASSVPVVLDDIAIVSPANVTGGSSLVPGQYYYLSKFAGQLTPFSTASGTVTASGGYAALTVVGQALSSTELRVEIEAPVVLYD